MVKKAEVRLAEDNTLIPHVKMGVEAGNGTLMSEHTKSEIPRFACRLLVVFNLVKYQWWSPESYLRIYGDVYTKPGSRTSADEEWPGRCTSDFASPPFEEVRGGPATADLNGWKWWFFQHFLQLFGTPAAMFFFPKKQVPPKIHLIFPNPLFNSLTSCFTAFLC